MKVLILIFIFSVSSCVSVEKDCLNKNQKNTVVIWGCFKSDNSYKTEYKLKSDALINYSLEKNNKKEDKVLNYKLSNKEVCDSFNEVMGLFVKLQSLNVPADSNCYIEYINPDANVHLRALWNPVHTNKGNQDFKQLFEKLMNLVR